MHFSGAILSAALTLGLAACGREPASEAVVVDEVRSAHALIVTDADGRPQTLLLAVNTGAGVYVSINRLNDGILYALPKLWPDIWRLRIGSK